MATKNIVPNANGEGSIGTAAKGWGGAFLTSAATSSTSAGAKLQLISDDGAGAMADTHQLGIIEFLGSEDGSNTISIGASIEAVADETFTASENASALVFKTTSGTTVSEVLRLDKDKLATFAGAANFAGSIALTGSASGLNFSADQDGSITMSQRNDGGRNLDIGAGGAGSGGGTNSNGGNLTLRSGGTKGTGTSTMHFRTSVAGNGYGLSTEQMKIDAVGDVHIMTGNLVIGTAGKGIDFSTESPSGSGTASALLDDYEEGVWTPTLTVTSGSLTFTPDSTTNAKYVKIGKQVTCWFYILTDAFDYDTGSALVQLNGQPFASEDFHVGGSVYYVANGFAGDFPSSIAYATTTRVYLIYRDTADDYSREIRADDFTDGTNNDQHQFWGMFHYTAAT